MNIIIPMAGWGSRLRPHTLTVPKPMIPIAGKPIVERLVEDLCSVNKEKIENIAFIIREDFGKEIATTLTNIAEKHGAKAHICFQDEPLGTAHAILCAKESLNGPVVVAFADTLFKADFTLDTSKDGVIWVNKIDDPSAFGVVKLNAENVITDFVEKPKDFVSDLAIIGVYFFRDGENLKNELQYLLDNDIKEKGEYQLTNALENMKRKGAQFLPGQVIEWLDCGNKDATVQTNQRVLEFLAEKNTQLRASSVTLVNSTVIEPCFIGEGVEIVGSVVGPHVSIGNNSKIVQSVIKNSIIQHQTSVKNKLIENAMIGSKATLEGKFQEYSVGDYTALKD